MILIVDNTQRKMRKEIKDHLFSRCIPCAVTDTSRMDKYFPCDIIVVTERYILEDVKYMADIYKCPTVILYDEKEDLLSFVLRIYSEICEKQFKKGFILKFVNENLFFAGMPIRITDTQKMMVKMLSFADGWVTRESLALYCLRDSSSDTSAVSVHISNINKKVKEVTGLKLIEFKRFSGYRINVK